MGGAHAVAAAAVVAGGVAGVAAHNAGEGVDGDGECILIKEENVRCPKTNRRHPDTMGVSVDA